VNVMTRNQPKAILVDLDDTIIIFSACADEYWHRVCDRFAQRIDGMTSQKLFDGINESRTWFWSDPERHRVGRLDLITARREIVADAFRRMEMSALTLVNEIADAYSEERKEGIRLIPGAIEALRSMRQQGIKLALITNGDTAGQKEKIEAFGLADYFDCILIEEEFGRGKPSEEVYLEALSILGVAPEETWMVGDNLEWDVAAPQRLGIKGIWVDGNGSGMDKGSTVRPDRIIRSLSELQGREQ